MTSEGIEKKAVRRVDKMNKRLKRGGENWLHKKESGFQCPYDAIGLDSSSNEDSLGG